MQVLIADDNKISHIWLVRKIIMVSSVSPKRDYKWILGPLSSPRAGPKSLPAESARAVTDRRCPHRVGRGKTF